MKYICILFTALLCSLSASAQTKRENIVTTDVDNFWKAYDKLTSTTDSAQQYAYLNQLFMQKASAGQKAMFEARDYTAKSYIDALHQYPQFWQAMRPRTLKAKNYSVEINKGIEKLRTIYPQLRQATIYFTVGALRSGGTLKDSMVLIGSEIAMADADVPTQEFDANFSNLVSFFKRNPVNDMAFTNVHEYVHTQQKTIEANNLLAECVIEGVAEFIAEQATGTSSTQPAMRQGPQHDGRIKEVFISQMFNLYPGFWLYSNDQNEFNLRDLGYYVGSAISRAYYNRATDKKQAIKDMIELDYNNDKALFSFVNRSGYFAKPVESYRANYEKSRPRVTGLNELTNGREASATLKQLTINFSVPMDKRFRGFELGPLGEGNLLKVQRFVGFSEDGRSATIEVSLMPDRRYQLMLSPRFRDLNGVNIKPYVIDFWAKGAK